MMSMRHHDTSNTLQSSRTQNKKSLARLGYGHGRRRRHRRMPRTATDPYRTTSPVMSPSTDQLEVDEDIVIEEGVNPYKNIPAAEDPSSRIDGAPESAESPAAKNQISESPRPTAAATEDDLILTGGPINPYKNVPAAATPTLSYEEPDGIHRVASIASPTWLTSTGCPTASPSTTDSLVSSTDLLKTSQHLDSMPSDPPGLSIVTTSRVSGYSSILSVTSSSMPSVSDSIPKNSDTISTSSWSGPIFSSTSALSPSVAIPTVTLQPTTSRFNFPSTRSPSWTTCTRPKSLFPDPTTPLFPAYPSPETTFLPLPTPPLTTATLTPTPTPTETPAPESGGGLSRRQIAMYVGIPTSVCTVIGVLALGIWRYKKRRKQRLRNRIKENIRVLPNSSPRPGAMQGATERLRNETSTRQKEWWEGAYEYD